MKTDSISTSFKIKTIIFAMALFFLLTSSKGFAQTANQSFSSNTTELVEKTNVSNASENSNDTSLDFINWFMGTKQKVNSNQNSSDVNASKSKKKQLISSGVEPNRILYKVLLKKVIDQDVATV